MKPINSYIIYYRSLIVDAITTNEVSFNSIKRLNVYYQFYANEALLKRFIFFFFCFVSEMDEWKFVLQFNFCLLFFM